MEEIFKQKIKKIRSKLAERIRQMKVSTYMKRFEGDNFRF